MFGFLKSQIIGENIKVLTTDIVQEFHDQLLVDYVSTDLKFLKEGESMFNIAKSRNGYL